MGIFDLNGAPWLTLAVRRAGEDDEELRRTYGESIRIQMLGIYNLIHLDEPDSTELKERLHYFLDQGFRHRPGVTRDVPAEGLDIIFLRRKAGSGLEGSRKLGSEASRRAVDGVGTG